MNRALRPTLAILAILVFGIAGAVLFRAGADDQQGSVVLKWNAPAPGAGSAVTGYKVYRNEPDKNYVPIASVEAPPYVDRTVKRGMKYTYYVTSVDATGRESLPSNYISVTP